MAEHSSGIMYFLDDLMSKKRHLEAGQVLLEYAKDVRQAVIAFVEGSHFSEARRVVSDFVRTRLNPIQGRML